MSTLLGNGIITFGDSTSISSANFTASQITGIPTKLSQFTNTLGNYGWLGTTDVVTGGPYNGIPYQNGSGFALNYNGTGHQFGIYCTNCNCNCNC